MSPTSSGITSAQSKNIRNLYLVGAAFAFLATALSALLICKHVFPGLCSLSLGCTISDVDGCADLGMSRHSKIFGTRIPIAVVGFFYYCFLLVAFVELFRRKDEESQRQIRAVLLPLVIFGFIFDIALAYVNFAKLVVPCMLCAYTYVCMLGLAGVMAAIFMKTGAKFDGIGVFMIGIKKTILPVVVALVVTLGVYVSFSQCAKSGGAVRVPEGEGLFPAEEAPKLLAEFRSLKPASIDTNGIQTFEGSDKAYITIHDFADFRCPHCYDATVVLQKALRRWPDRIRVYYRNFPLDGTCNPMIPRKQDGSFSCNGAQAVLCAPEQKIFVALYHSIYDFQRTQTMISLDELNRLTQKLNGNWPQLLQCMGSPRTQALLNRDIQDARTLDIKSTPTLVLQNRILPAGTPPEMYLMHVLDALVYESEGKTAYDEYMKRMGSR